MSYLLLLTAVPSLQEARKLSTLLLKQKLAACIQISSPVESHYRWKAKNMKSREFQLTIKTKSSLYSQIEAALLKNHSYEVPEIIAVPITKGSRNYLKWLEREVGGPQSRLGPK